MAFEELKENIAEADSSVRSYLESSQEYYKLKGFKFVMRGITSFSKVLLVGTVALMGIFFLSVGASFAIGQAIDNTAYGFLIVGGFYVFLGIIFYLIRRRLNRPLLEKFSEFYFDEI